MRPCEHRNRFQSTLWWSALLFTLVSHAEEPAFWFNLATVLQGDSALAEGEQAARCVGTDMMAKGQKLAVDRLNEGHGHGVDGRITKFYVRSAEGRQHRILFNYTRHLAACDEGEHNAQVEQALRDGSHFLLGNTHFAFSEAALASKAEKLVYHCCADSDELFEMDYKYVFGATGSVGKDTRHALTSMALEGSITRLLVYYTEDFRYATVACTSAIEYTNTLLAQINPAFQLVSVLKYSFRNVSSIANFYDSVLAEEVVRSKAEAVVGCDSKEAGIQTAKAFGRRNLHLKSTFMTWAPMYPDFVESVGPETAEHTLTVTYWHPSARGLADTFFGTPAEYAAAYEQAYGFPPDVLNALASVTVLSLAWAIQTAFKQCTFAKPSMDASSLLFDSDAIKCVDSLGVPFPNSPNGYDLVLKSLASQSLTTFFGEIEFNRFRRNIAAQPLTLQIQSGLNQVVLPLEQASKKIIMPVPKPAPPEREAHVGVLERDEFIALVVVVVMGVLLIVITWLLVAMFRRIRQQHADRVRTLLVIPPEHLQIINLPVRLMDGSWESGKALLRNSLVALEPLSEVTLAGTLGDSYTQNNTRKIPEVAFSSLDGGSAKGQRHRPITSPETAPYDWRNIDPTVEIDMEAVFDQDPKHIKQTLSGIFVNGSSQSQSMRPSLRGSSLRAPACEAVAPACEAVAPACEPQLASPSLRGSSPSLQGSSLRGSSQSQSMRPSLRGSEFGSVGNDGVHHIRPTRFWKKQHTCQGDALSHNQILDLVLQARTLQHPSIVPVTGIVWSLPGLSDSAPVLVTECQELGTLTSVMDNETIELDFVKQLDTAKDLASALAYFYAQNSPLPNKLGPALPNKLSGVMLNKHCRAKLRVPLTALQGCDALGKKSKPDSSTPGMMGEAKQHELTDVCQFGLGVACMFTAERSSSSQFSSSFGGLQQMVEGCALSKKQLHELQFARGLGIAQLLRECCALDERQRPCFTQIFKRLEDAEPEMIRVAQQASAPQLHKLHNKQSADKLLYELFPAKVAEALKNGHFPDPEPYPCVSLFFSDIVGYTDICSKLATQDVMDMLHRLYSRFDNLATARGLFKVETIGDAYMCAGNLRHPQPDTHAALMADFAFGCLSAANEEPVCLSRPGLGFIHIRVGIHTGPVTGAVVGTLNRRFCLFGDCVNVASRMESTSTKDHVQCSLAFQELLQQQWPAAASLAEPQEAKPIKGKGIMRTFYLYPPHQRAPTGSDASNASLGPALRVTPVSRPVLEDPTEDW